MKLCFVRPPAESRLQLWRIAVCLKSTGLHLSKLNKPRRLKHLFGMVGASKAPPPMGFSSARKNVPTLNIEVASNGNGSDWHERQPLLLSPLPRSPMSVHIDRPSTPTIAQRAYLSHPVTVRRLSKPHQSKEVVVLILMTPARFAPTTVDRARLLRAPCYTSGEISLLRRVTFATSPAYAQITRQASGQSSLDQCALSLLSGPDSLCCVALSTLGLASRQGSNPRSSPSPLGPSS